MKETLEVYKKGHNYMMDVEKLYADVLSKFGEKLKNFSKKLKICNLLGKKNTLQPKKK